MALRTELGPSKDTYFFESTTNEQEGLDVIETISLLSALIPYCKDNISEKGIIPLFFAAKPDFTLSET